MTKAMKYKVFQSLFKKAEQSRKEIYVKKTICGEELFDL